MDKGENSAENDKAADLGVKVTTEIGVKVKEEPQEETIKVGNLIHIWDLSSQSRSSYYRHFGTRYYSKTITS